MKANEMKINTTELVITLSKKGFCNVILSSGTYTTGEKWYLQNVNGVKTPVANATILNLVYRQYINAEYTARFEKPEITKTKAPKEPEKTSKPKHWLFPKKIGRKTEYASEYFDRFKYEEKAKDMGCWAPVKKIVPGKASREAVYRALGAIENPEWIEWANKKLGR